jgi:hypothetical protein
MSMSADTAPRTPICASCGVVAPVQRTTCACCDRELGRPRAFAPLSGDLYFTAVRATTVCRACGFPSPLDGLWAAESVDCAQCGSLQRFEPDAWNAGLEHARTVGDLAGPNPEGRAPSAGIWIGDDNPHRTVGMTETFSKHEVDRFALEASPGWPVCHRCSVALQCDAQGTRVATRCPTCGAQAQYELPGRFVEDAAATGVAGVVADEHRLGRVEVRVQATAAGLMALLCPQCGAAVQSVTGGGGATNTVECAYCKTLAVIPPRARPRGERSLVKPSVFWVAFRGRSPARAKLTEPTPAVRAGKTLGVFMRGLKPLPGIDLAPRRPGVDVRQWTFTLAMTALALGLGYGLYLAVVSAT